MTDRPDRLETALGELLTGPDAGRCPRGVELARYAADDLAQAERATFEGHVATCADCREDLETFRATAEAWRHALADAASGVRVSGPVRRWWRRPLLVGALGAAAAAAAVLVLVLAGPERVRDVPGPGGDAVVLRPMGSWSLHVVAERKGRLFRVEDGTRLLTGDRLGLFYSASRAGHLMVLYADEAGAIVWLHPGVEPASAAAPAGDRVRLADGAILSPGHGCEWVVGLFSADPFGEPAARALVARLLERRRGCRLEAPEGTLARDSGIRRVEIKVLGVTR